MSAEFSRRVDVDIIKDEPKTLAQFVSDLYGVDDIDQDQDPVLYQQYLDHFQPYRFHAKGENFEIVDHSEGYLHEAGAINAVELLFGDDTTMYWRRTYGEDRGDKLLRYGKTDRDHQDLSLLDGTTAFMRAAGQLDDPPTFGAYLHDDLRELRRKLLNEEYSEYLTGEVTDDLVETVDGLLDIIVIAWGSLLAYVGEDKAKAAASEVVRSNLDKIGPDGRCVKRDDGKILKPEGWQPPNIAGAIA